MGISKIKTNKKRVVLSTLFNNASLSNYNVDNMISSNPAGVKGLLDTIINNPVNNNDEICYQIAKNEVDTLCNILKDRNNYKALDSISEEFIVLDNNVNNLNLNLAK